MASVVVAVVVIDDTDTDLDRSGTGADDDDDDDDDDAENDAEVDADDGAGSADEGGARVEAIEAATRDCEAATAAFLEEAMKSKLLVARGNNLPPEFGAPTR
jgi:hypothetical protein